MTLDSHVLRLIHNEAEYRAALEALDSLLDSEPEPDTPEDEQMELLALLIEKYEEEQVSISLPHPIEAIRFRMDQAGLRPLDLTPYIGSRGRVSEVLSGKRLLTLPMIRRLSRGLGIPAEVLVQEYEVTDNEG